MAKRSRILRWTQAVEWAEADLTLGTNALTLIKRLIKIARDTVITPRSLTASFSILDDPIDERIYFTITDGDPSDFPVAGITGALLESMLENALWSDLEAWRSIGTDSGPIATDEEARSVKTNRDYSTDEFGHDADWLVAAVVSNTTSRISFNGALIVDVAYRQYTFNQDDASFEQSPEELGE